MSAIHVGDVLTVNLPAAIMCADVVVNVDVGDILIVTSSSYRLKRDKTYVFRVDMLHHVHGPVWNAIDTYKDSTSAAAAFLAACGLSRFP